MRFIYMLLTMGWATALWGTPPGKVVFSELMWMGSPVSTADEWVELCNRGETLVDLAGWSITRQLEDREVTMVRIEEGRLAPGATFLIANFAADDTRSALAAQPQLVDPGLSLPNTRLLLRLYDGDPEAGAHLVDVADDGSGAPLAGDTQEKKAMVRLLLDTDGSLPMSWGTAADHSGWDDGIAASGTPGQVPEDAALPDSAVSTTIRPATWASLKPAR
ncbi:MAG: lamin tail domain-containing protein [Candidatus Latescibacteria bacterium]|nr:lamin tail domain-containing protein [Candidatus Latescibacterota bacterium]